MKALIAAVTFMVLVTGVAAWATEEPTPPEPIGRCCLPGGQYLLITEEQCSTFPQSLFNPNPEEDCFLGGD